MGLTAVFERAGIAPKDVARLIRFAVVGFSGTLLDLVLLTVFIRGFGMATLPANTLSYLAGIINGFVLNRYWTFPEARSKRIATQLSQFVVVSLIGLALNDLIVILSEPLFSGLLGNYAYLAAKLIATVLVFFWNFAANRRWTYNDLDQAA